MEECLPHFLIGVLVVPSRIVKRTKQFIPPTLFPTTLHQLGEENPHRVVVGNRKSMRMLSHDCTSILQIVFVIAPPISSISKSTPKFTVASLRCVGKDDQICSKMPDTANWSVRRRLSANRKFFGGLLMKEKGSAHLMHLCQAVSPSDETCDYLATVHCTNCAKWFCDSHAEDEEWHSCALPHGDEGGEA
jgi:hypothetical protein